MHRRWRTAPPAPETETGMFPAAAADDGESRGIESRE